MDAAPLRRRVYVALGALGLFFAVILGRFAWLMLFSPLPEAEKKAVVVERGPILDRKGRILAAQSVVYDLEIWKPSVSDLDQTVDFLAALTGIGAQAVRERLATSNGAVLLQRSIPWDRAEEMESILALSGQPGIRLIKNSARMYPHGSQAAHVIGFTGVDNEGLEGIERAFDRDLRGVDNSAAADGTIYGNQVVLTIDMEVQNRMEALADTAMEENKPDGLVVLVMEARTGEILSLVSRPGFDLNHYRESDAEARRNRATSFVYEPGSVFKIYTVAGVMSRGTINEHTVFKTAGGFRSTRFRDPITDLSNYGDISAEGIISYSSNVGAALAAETLSDQDFLDTITRFGFGARTGLELGEERGILKPLEQWSARTKPTLAFGQEIGVTAIQMVQAASALANGGTMLQPRLVKRIMGPQGTVVQDFAPSAHGEAIDPASASAMLRFMNTATEEGTARRSRIQGMDISVKTGTSQTIDPRTGTYSAESFIASSLALFPTEDPKLIVYIAVFQPRGQSIYGGRVVAPLIGTAAEFLVSYLGLPREGDQVVVQEPGIRINLPTLPPLEDRVPDFRGLPLRTLMPLLSQRRYPVSIEGSGWVVDQSPAPDTPLEPGTKIWLRLAERPWEANR